MPINAPTNLDLHKHIAITKTIKNKMTATIYGAIGNSSCNIRTIPSAILLSLLQSIG